jgi:hypothetical protein
MNDDLRPFAERRLARLHDRKAMSDVIDCRIESAIQVTGEMLDEIKSMLQNIWERIEERV